MPAKRTQRKIRNRRRKVGRKSRRVKKRVGGGENYLLKKNNNVLTRREITLANLNGASFYDGDKKIYNIKIEPDPEKEPKDPKEPKTETKPTSVVWVFDNINKNSFGFFKTNIKSFLKIELPYTHIDFFKNMQEKSPNGEFFNMFSKNMGEDIETNFRLINNALPLEVVLTDNNIIFKQNNKEIFKIEYLSEINKKALEDPNSPIKIPEIKSISKEIISYYDMILRLKT